MGEAQHPQAGQFAAPFRKGDAGAVVDDAEADAAGQQGGHHVVEQDELADGLVEAVNGGAVGHHAQDPGAFVQLGVHRLLGAGVDAQVGAGDHGALAHQGIEGILLHVGGNPQVLLGDAQYRHLPHWSVALEDLHGEQVAWLDVEDVGGQVVSEHHAFRGQLDGLEIAVQGTMQDAVRLDAIEGMAVTVVLVAEDGGHVPEALDVIHAGDGGQFEQGVAAGGLDEGDGQVLPGGLAELHVHHEVDGSLLVVAHHHQAAGAGDAEHRQYRLQWPPFDVAQDHARGLGEPALQADAFHQGGVVDHRRFRPHAFRRRQADGPADGVEGAADGGGDADPQGDEDDAGIELVVQVGEAEGGLHVDVGQALSEPGAQARAQGDAEHGHQQHQLDVVPADGRRGVAEGLEDGDLLPLQGDQPADHHVEQEGCHSQEDRREDGGGGLQLLEFLGQEAVGELVLATIGAGAAVGAEDVVDPVDHVLDQRARGQAQADVVEAAFHVVGGSQGVAPHPDHTIALEVREHGAGGDLVDVFRRDRDPHDGQGLALAVDDGGQAVTRFEAMGVGEGVGEDHLVAAVGLDHAAALEVQLIELCLACVR